MPICVHENILSQCELCRRSAMTAPAKPDIDEQIALLTKEIDEHGQCYDTVHFNLYEAQEILATLKAHKRIMAAEVPEPVAWMQSDHLNKLTMHHCGSQSMLARVSDHQLQPDYKPLYGPDLLAVYQRALGQLAELRRKYAARWIEFSKMHERAETAERQLAACQKECEEQARLNGMGSEREARLMAQLAELREKYERKTD